MNIILCVVTASILVNVAMSDTPKEKLKSIEEKFQVIKTALDALNMEVVVFSGSFLSNIGWALEAADTFNEALDALKVEWRNIDGIKNARRLATELSTMIENIGIYTKDARNPEKAKELQQSASRTVGELCTTLKSLQADLTIFRKSGDYYHERTDPEKKEEKLSDSLRTLIQEEVKKEVAKQTKSLMEKIASGHLETRVRNVAPSRSRLK
ncbi:hypothetical protein DdX_16544 [Ditylenchus destructor]|uniref:Uncharacterized protein n=1 Tax=Ditylenchus destructor TaxID=166010 RepID=A0AAD4MQ88_9BILA|nr:hypothetical protein DdX_16544 [Ditylenchus destructor]